MHTEDYKTRAVSNWLLLGVGMTIIQIALGGITRLTGSGLSITEWDVVTGTLPPMSEAAWQILFEKYKTTPQFQLFQIHLFLGMVSPFVGKNHWFSICDWLYIFFGKKIFSTKNDSTIDSLIFIGCITRSHWLDYGRKRIRRRRCIC